MYYCILEKTPYPGHFEAMATWKLQKAEYDLKLAQRFYHERAVRLGWHTDAVLLYELADCIAIIRYWQEHQERTRYKVLGYVGSIE